MKLIIDIDDEMVCNDIKNKALDPETATDEVIINALYNSIPYEERSQGEFVKLLNERIDQSVCKWCQMNKHCELCEISRVFMIISLTDEEMKGGAV